jgi:hypothetical protein
MKIIQLAKSVYNNKKYDNFDNIKNIFEELEFKVLSDKFQSIIKSRDYAIEYKDEVYIIRVPTTYEFLEKLHDNILNLFIKDSKGFEKNINQNNDFNSINKYEGCSEQIKNKLLKNKIIKIVDPISDNIFYIIDYNPIEKYILLDNKGNAKLKMNDEMLKAIFKLII